MTVSFALHEVALALALKDLVACRVLAVHTEISVVYIIAVVAGNDRVAAAGAALRIPVIIFVGIHIRLIEPAERYGVHLRISPLLCVKNHSASKLHRFCGMIITPEHMFVNDINRTINFQFTGLLCSHINKPSPEVNETLAFRRRVRLRTNAVVGEGARRAGEGVQERHCGLRRKWHHSCCMDVVKFQFGGLHTAARSRALSRGEGAELARRVRVYGRCSMI